MRKKRSGTITEMIRDGRYVTSRGSEEIGPRFHVEQTIGHPFEAFEVGDSFQRGTRSLGDAAELLTAEAQEDRPRLFDAASCFASRLVPRPVKSTLKSQANLAYSSPPTRVWEVSVCS